MPAAPVPLSRELVPAVPPSVPEGFTLVSTAIAGGLPDVIRLDGDLTLLVVVPSGLASTWRDRDPAAVISHSLQELDAWSPRSEEIGHARRVPARLLLRAGRTVVGALPLVAGVRRRLPDSAEVGVQVEVVVIGWDLRAGSFRGAGEVGSRVEVAWRRADRGVDRYSGPTISPHLRARLDASRRLESDADAREPAERRRSARKHGARA